MGSSDDGDARTSIEDISTNFGVAVIGITKDFRGLWSHNQASIDILLWIIPTVNRGWFVAAAACFDHQNGVKVILILLVLIRVDVAGCRRWGEKKACSKSLVGRSYTKLWTRNQDERRRIPPSFAPPKTVRRCPWPVVLNFVVPAHLLNAFTDCWM
jgi:hypothetical protein